MRSLCAVLWLALVMGCSKTEAPPQTAAELEYPEQEMFGARISFYSDDRLATVIEAGRVIQYDKQNLIILDSGIVADFFDENGNQRTRIWADSGTAHENTRNLNAYGHVVARSDSGEQLETEILRYDNTRGLILADGPVKISTPTDTIYGLGFRADKNLKNWTVTQPTGTTLRDRPAATAVPAGARGDSASTDSLE